MLARLALLALNAALFAALAGLIATPIDPAPATAGPLLNLVRRAEPAEPDATPLAPLRALERQHALSRPLFEPDRRPWQPPAPPPEPESEPEPEPEIVYEEPEIAPDFVLVGVGIARGRARALLRSAAGDELGWVAEGETVLDWTIAAISEASVTMRHSEREVSLSLHSEAPSE